MGGKLSRHYKNMVLYQPGPISTIIFANYLQIAIKLLVTEYKMQIKVPFFNIQFLLHTDTQNQENTFVTSFMRINFWI